MRRALRRAVVVGAAGVLPIAALTLVGSSAHAAAGQSSQTSGSCKAPIQGPAMVGRIGGILRPAVTRSCAKANPNNDPAIGDPPLLFHGGKVMGTRSTGPVVVTPIFWNPSGHTMAGEYKNILKRYLGDVASQSGKHTNVYSTLFKYFGTNGGIRYQMVLGTPVDDRNALPASGCDVASNDTTGIYANNSGYNACLDDKQVIAETKSVVSAQGLPVDLGHIYVTFLPKHVESCFYAGSTTTDQNGCTINHQPSALYCAYHSMAHSGMVYANMPFPIFKSPVGYTCGSDARFPGIQKPNGNANADTEISPTSHEIMEAITDPDTTTGWYDKKGYENGDECAYVYGSASGTPGQLYNQVINGRHYLTQEEFSNTDFHYTGGGCLQAE